MQKPTILSLRGDCPTLAASTCAAEPPEDVSACEAHTSLSMLLLSSSTESKEAKLTLQADAAMLASESETPPGQMLCQHSPLPTLPPACLCKPSHEPSPLQLEHHSPPSPPESPQPDRHCPGAAGPQQRSASPAPPRLPSPARKRSRRLRQEQGRHSSNGEWTCSRHTPKRPKLPVTQPMSMLLKSQAESAIPRPMQRMMKGVKRLPSIHATPQPLP
mmetsp:Transcript_142533/g.454847  ORF Transcript_142533/g.454847 Transcript_142533/m.454847 type:complete len:217 (+) Transcript_142533:930-1580(+)